MGKRAVPGGRAYGVPALVHRDPAYPEDPMVTTRRLVQPPIRDGTGVKERPSRRPIGDKTKEIRFESHYDLRWHGEEKGAFTDKEMKKMHRGIKGTIPGLRPRGSAGLQTRVRGPRGTA